MQCRSWLCFFLFFPGLFPSGVWLWRKSKLGFPEGPAGVHPRGSAVGGNPFCGRIPARIAPEVGLEVGAIRWIANRCKGFRPGVRRRSVPDVGLPTGARASGPECGPECAGGRCQTLDCQPVQRLPTWIAPGGRPFPRLVSKICKCSQLVCDLECGKGVSAWNTA